MAKQPSKSIHAVILLLTVVAVLVSSPCDAQVSTAQINGTIRDSSGSVVPGATVVLKNVDTNVETQRVTNERGVYILPNILPGNYTLEASKTGFSTSRLEPFALVVNQASVFDFHLAVGRVQESVTVEAQGSQVQSATAELGNVITRQQVVDLPSGGNIQNLMRLTPGVSAITTGQSSIPSVNGQMNRSSVYMLDGMSNQATFYSNLAVNPIMETLEEFKVQSHNDTAEVGGIMGGTVNTVTKSGTNELHGNLLYRVSNTAFNARNTFQPSVTPYKQNTFGGTAGGPIILPKVYNGRNRTFFYAGYQAMLTRTPALTYLRVPTAANLRGDLRDWTTAIYNPFTTRADPSKAGAFVRDPFPGNIIPASLINPGMLYYAQTVLPQPEYTGVADMNAINRTPNRTNAQSLSARVDHKFRDADSIWARYTGTYSSGSQATTLPSMPQTTSARAHNVMGNWVHIVGPSAVLQVQIGRVYAWNGFANLDQNIPSDFVSKVGYSTNIMTPYQPGDTRIPGFSVANFFSGGNEQRTLTRTGDSWNYKAGFSKLSGRHMWKIGGEYNGMGYYYTDGQTSVGFANAQTANPSALGTTGSSLASFLLGVPDNAIRRDTRETTVWWAGVIGFYAQDSWKVTNNLTVNLGLRYDRTFIPPVGTDDGNNNYIGNMDYNLGVYVLQRVPAACGAAGKAPCIPAPAGAPAGWLPANVVVSPDGKTMHDTTKNFQPRIGLAWRLGPKTVFRASSGVFFDSYSGINQLSRNFAGTWPTIGYQTLATLNYPTSSQPLPSVPATNPLPSASYPEATPFTQVVRFVDPRWQNPYSLQWNAGFQHQISSSMLVTLNYVGSGGRRVDVGAGYNMASTPGPGPWQSRAPYPYMPTCRSWDRSVGTSSYNALQTTFERRWSTGLAFSASYTWSKSIDPGSSGLIGVEGQSIQNPYNFKADRSVSSYDLSHNLVLSWVYELPFGSKKSLRSGNRVVDYVIGNWQLNGIADIRSGIPYTITVAGDIANTGNPNSYMRPNIVGDWRVDNPTPGRWFNKAAFAAPAQYTFGNLGRNTMRSQGVHRFDLSAYRKFPIRERAHLELRAEAYNAFNAVTYQAPTAEFTSPNFGKVLSAMASRTMQLSARIFF